MALKIYPLCLGTLEMSGSVLCRQRHYEDGFFPCIGYLILGGEKTIVVDTGAPEPDMNVKTVRKLLRDEKDYLLPQLAEYGIAPRDVDIIINTHLHWDHIYGNNKLPRAEILVQQAELDYYHNPLPCDRNSYEKNKDVPFVSTFLDRVHPVVGDCEVMSGVRLMLTPGHTLGSQAVVVDTKAGTYVLPGDNVNLNECLEFDPPWPSGIIMDMRDFYASMERIKALGNYTILPAHEKTVLGQKCYG